MQSSETLTPTPVAAPTPAAPPLPAELPPSWADWCDSTTATLRGADVLRSLRPLNPRAGDSAAVLVDVGTHERWMANTPSVGDEVAADDVCAPPIELALFSSNDYLGLSTHPEVRAAAAAAAAAHGCGPRSSSLVAGFTCLHQELESELARLKEAEAALLLPTGYAANTAVLGALADSPSCAIFSDELNHASIIDGARLASKGAGAALHVYRHNDMEHLDALLGASAAPRKLIVSDSLFSMDGDFADCRALAALRERHGALLALDEAHATLVCGDNGGGAAEMFGVAHAVDVHVGTLSKAFGAHGGFVASSRPLKQLLLSKGRPGIYSTALPAPAVAAATAALRAASPTLREQLWANVRDLADAIGTDASRSSPICPLVVGDERAALAASAALLREGIHVPAIRPPTVPRGTARLRVALSAAHTGSQIASLAAALLRQGLPRRLPRG